MNARFVIMFGVVAGLGCVGTPAQAHWGHLGELAGHGHWAGLAAALAGGVIAAWLIKDRKQTDDETENADAEPETAEEATEAA